MHKKVMLELPDGSRRWGYATTEHSASSYGNPVVTLNNIAYSAGDMEISNINIIVNDADAVNVLKKAGYNPISRERKYPHTTLSLPPELLTKLKIDANEGNITLNDKIMQILSDYYKNKAPNQ